MAGFLLAGGGVALLASAVAWRAMTRKRAFATVRWALMHQDPAIRQAAFAIAGQQGLSRYADLLLEQASRETDRGIARALAEAVARHQWEPADNPALVQLRLWAQRALAEEPIARVDLPRPPPGPHAPLPVAAAVPGGQLSYTNDQVADLRKWLREQLEEQKRAGHGADPRPGPGEAFPPWDAAPGPPPARPPRDAPDARNEIDQLSQDEFDRSRPPHPSPPPAPAGAFAATTAAGVLERRMPSQPAFDLSTWSAGQAPRRRGLRIAGPLLTIFDLAILSLLAWSVGRYCAAFLGFPKGADAWGHISKVRLLIDNFPHVQWNYAWYAGIPHFGGSYPPLYHALVGTAAALSGTPVPKVMVGATIGCVLVTVLSFYAFVRAASSSRLAGIVAATLLVTTPAYWTYIIQYGLYPRVMAFAFLNVALFSATLHARRPTRSRFVATVLALGACLSTHPIVGIPGVIVVAAIVTVPADLTMSGRLWRATGLFAAVGGVVAYFYVPALSAPPTESTFASGAPLALIALFRPLPDLYRQGYVDSLAPAVVPLASVFLAALLFRVRAPRSLPRYLVQPQMPASLPMAAYPVGGANGSGGAELGAGIGGGQGEGRPGWLAEALPHDGESDRRVRAWRSRRQDLSFPLRISLVCAGTGLMWLGYACLGYLGLGRFSINHLPAWSVLVYIGWMFAAAGAVAFGAVAATLRRASIRVALAGLVLLAVSASGWFSVRLLPTGVRDFDIPAKREVMRLLPAEAEQRQYRIGGSVDATTDWINSRSGVPQTRGYQAQAIPHLDWQAWLEQTLGDPARSVEERNFLLDWYAVRWLYAGPHQIELAWYAAHPESYVPLATSTRADAPYRTYRFTQASPILTAQTTTTALVIGKDVDYDLLLRSLAPSNANSRQVIPVRGPERIDDLTLDELNQFDVVVLHGASAGHNKAAADLLARYVDGGGGLVIEAADSSAFLIDLSHVEGAPIPVTAALTAPIAGRWGFDVRTDPVSDGIDFGAFAPPRFGDRGAWETVSGSALKPWAHPVVLANKLVVVAAGQYGHGRVVWTGMNLPYHAADYHNAAESTFLARMIAYVSRERPHPAPRYRAQFVDAERRQIVVEPGATGVLLKETGTADWHATVDRKTARIYPAGPGMMYVPLPPGGTASHVVVFAYRTSVLGRVAIGVSAIAVLALALYWIGVVPTARIRRRRSPAA
jgi:hypothetical protein